MFDYTILYVADVQKTVSFYQQAFGLEPRLVHESLSYAEMHSGADSGEHVLAFAELSFIQGMLPVEIQPNKPHGPAAGFQISFRTPDVTQAYEKAIAAGAVAVAPPETKPWGQEVAFVRDIDGILVELCGRVQGGCED
jgi:catechol 2,3-dioxygenase-like lactoylglutathione lyase family enzyme